VSSFGSDRASHRRIEQEQWEVVSDETQVTFPASEGDTKANVDKSATLSFTFDAECNQQGTQEAVYAQVKNATMSDFL